MCAVLRRAEQLLARGGQCGALQLYCYYFMCETRPLTHDPDVFYSRLLARSDTGGGRKTNERERRLSL